MLTIDAINDMLSYLGESPLDPADPDYTSHPLYESALRILELANRRIQSKGWWFNERTLTLTPSSGAVAIPNTYLALSILRHGYNADYTIRDGALFNLTDNTATITQALEARVRELVAFEDLPETAAVYIAADAAERFAKTYDGDAVKIASIKEDAAKAYMLMNADHIRNVGVNLYHTASMGPVMANNWYSRYQQR